LIGGIIIPFVKLLFLLICLQIHFKEKGGYFTAFYLLPVAPYF